jgi:hypothetical protein
LLNPQLEPLKFEVDEKDRSVVTIHQIGRDLNGDVLLDKTVK